MLKYNATNPLDLPSDNNKEDINLKASNNGKEAIKSANINNNKKGIRPVDIGKERLATLNWIPQNTLLSELSSIFGEVTFSESEFPASTPVLDTRYK